MNLSWWRNESRLRALASAKQQADDEIRRLRAERDALQAQLVTALEDGRAAREHITDWLAEMRFGRPIFGPFTQVESEEVVPVRRPHGRDLVRGAAPIVINPEDFHATGTDSLTP